MSDDICIDITNLIVVLDIHEGAPPDQGWTPVDSSDGRLYSYKFTGGNHCHKNGQICHPIDKVWRTVTVKLHDKVKDRFEFDRVAFIFDDDNQLRWRDVKDKTATIENKCDEEMDAQYAVRLREVKNKNVTLFCDPAIKNKHPE